MSLATLGTAAERMLHASVKRLRLLIVTAGAVYEISVFDGAFFIPVVRPGVFRVALKLTGRAARGKSFWYTRAPAGVRHLGYF